MTKKPLKLSNEALFRRQVVSEVGSRVLAGQPKAGKTWLALEIAVSVASGAPCLGAYAVADRGPVLWYLAEDSHVNAYDRVSGICAHRDVDLKDLDLLLLSTPVLRLDSATEQPIRRSPEQWHHTSAIRSSDISKTKCPATLLHHHRPGLCR